MMTLDIQHDAERTIAHCRLTDDRFVYLHIISLHRQLKIVNYERALYQNAQKIDVEVISAEIDSFLKLNLPPIANWIVRGLNGVPPLSAYQLSVIPRTV